MEELLDELHGAIFFFILNVKSIYHQISMGQGEIPKTMFWTHEGHYKFLVIPFTFKNILTFQLFMNRIFCLYLHRFIFIFFHDILVYSSNFSSHQKCIYQVFQLLDQHQFHLNVNKCIFRVWYIVYLGHFISEVGAEVDGNNVEVMRQWSTPNNM